MAYASFHSCTGSAPVSGELLTLKGSGTKPDVAVAIRTLVVEVERSQAATGAVVPVAATDREPSNA